MFWNNFCHLSRYVDVPLYRTSCTLGIISVGCYMYGTEYLMEKLLTYEGAL